MSTSAEPRPLRALVIWGSVSILTALFAAGYEQLSHGVISAFMTRAFLIPLLLGCGGSALALCSHGGGAWSAALWHLAVGVLTVGSLVQGALEIYGTANRMTLVYAVSGALFAILALLAHLNRL